LIFLPENKRMKDEEARVEAVKKACLQGKKMC
jgi:hypothetical protein